uniref:AAA domain-containing protein n=1 Tax=Parastrongyloides trichosuri TaxID=131310 RepID=A0A0N4ZMN9_PARTI
MNSLHKMATSSIVLLRPNKSHNFEKRRSRLHKLKEDIESHKHGKHSQESSESNNDNEKKSSSDDDQPENEKEKFKQQMKKVFAYSLFAYGIYYMFTASERIENQMTPISFEDFLNRILPSGCVYKIEISPEQDKAYIYVLHGSKLDDGTLLDPYYIVGINNIERFEHEIRRVESNYGIDPSNWTPIKYFKYSWVAGVATLVITLLIFSLPFILMSRMKGSFMNMFSNVMKAKFKVLDPNLKESKLNIKFKDVAGLHEAKIEIMEFVDYLKNPSKYTKLGAKLPKGAIMTGPPGCGKTLLAKALAAESSVPFISANGTEFIEMIGGLGASRMRDLFKLAKQKAPCMIYIDEIDAIGKKRSEGNSPMNGTTSEEEQTLNQLLVEMDGMDSGKGIIVFASTNRPDILDKALMRPGRFDRHVTVDLPTALERTELFELYLKKIKLDKNPSYYSGRLSQLTPGMSGADIANIVNEAAIHAASNKKTVVVEQDINYAIERVIAGPEKRSRTLVKEEKETVAYHEAGHALVGWLLEHTDALLKVTIVPRTSAALGFAQYTPRDRKLFTTEELFDRMCMMLGGRAAENICFGRITTGAHDDLQKVTKQAYAQVQIYGMNKKVGPLSFPPDQTSASPEFSKKPYGKQLARVMDEEAKALIAKAYYTTEDLIRKNHDKLDILAKELLKKESLTYEDVKNLIGPPPYGDKNVIEMAEQSLPNLEQNI